MARIWQSGFELNSLTAGVECDTTNVSGGGAVAIDTATVRSGTYSLKASNAGASGISRVNFRLLTSAGSGPYYARAYFNIADLPASTNNIMTIWDGTTVRSTLKLAADGTLELHDSGGKIGSSSSALSTGTWYRLELKYYSNGAATELEGKVDGTSFASTTSSSNSGTVDRLSVGMVSNNTSYELYVDDIAVNDTSGSYQTGYPGEGKIVHVMPTSAGDSSSWTGYAGSGANWERVDEFPPDDATSAIQSRTTNEVDEYGISAFPVDPHDTINTVAVGYRVNRSTGTTSSTFNVRLKGASGGLNESATWTASSTTWRTNDTDVSTAIGYPVVSYINPDTSTAWTGSTLDTAQIGIKTISGSGDRYVNLSAMWASVDYIEGTPDVAIAASQTYDGSFITTHTVTAVDTSATNPYTIGFSFNKNPTSEVSGATVDGSAATLVNTNENVNVCAIQTWAKSPSDGSSVWEFTTPTSKELSAIVVGLSGVSSGTPYNSTVETAGTYGTDARVTITGTAGSLFLVAVVAQGDKTFTAVNCTEYTELTASSGIGGAFLGYITATGGSQTVGANLSAADNYRISVIEIYAASGATTTSTSSSTSTSTSSTSTSMSTSTSSTSTSLSTSTSSTSTSLSTSTSTSTSSTSTSLSTSTSSTSTSQSTSTSTSTTQSMTTSTSSTSTSLSTSSTSQSTSTSSTSSSTSQSTSTSTTQSFTTSTSSTSSSSSTSSTSTSQSTSTSSTSTSQSTSTSSTSRSTSTSSTSSSTSTSISTSTSSTSVSTSTSTSTSSTSLSTSTSFSTSTSTSSTSSSTSSTSSSTSSTTTLPPDSRVIPTLKMPLKDLFIKHKMSR